MKASKIDQVKRYLRVEDPVLWMMEQKSKFESLMSDDADGSCDWEK